MRTLATLLILAAAPGFAAAQATKEDLKKLAVAGISEDVIIAYLKANGFQGRLSTDDLIELKSAGLGDRVLAEIIAPGSEPSAAPAEEREPEADAPAGDLPWPYGSATPSYSETGSVPDYGYGVSYSYYTYPYYDCYYPSHYAYPYFSYGIGFGLGFSYWWPYSSYCAPHYGFWWPYYGSCRTSFYRGSCGFTNSGTRVNFAIRRGTTSSVSRTFTRPSTPSRVRSAPLTSRVSASSSPRRTAFPSIMGARTGTTSYSRYRPPAPSTASRSVVPARGFSGSLTRPAVRSSSRPAFSAPIRPSTSRSSAPSYRSSSGSSFRSSGRTSSRSSSYRSSSGGSRGGSYSGSRSSSSRSGSSGSRGGGSRGGGRR